MMLRMNQHDYMVTPPNFAYCQESIDLHNRSNWPASWLPPSVEETGEEKKKSSSTLDTTTKDECMKWWKDIAQLLFTSENVPLPPPPEYKSPQIPIKTEDSSTSEPTQTIPSKSEQSAESSIDTLKTTHLDLPDLPQLEDLISQQLLENDDNDDSSLFMPPLEIDPDLLIGPEE